MKAMILAAGLGKRLGDITKNVPKALVEINGKSILKIAVEKVASHGFDDIIVNVHHFAAIVEKEIEFLTKKGFRISVSDERELLLETGGGLYKARWFFDNNPFLIYNADIITDLDLTSLYSFHIENKGLASLAVRNRHGSRFFLVDSEGKIRGWRNKATGEQIIISTKQENLSELAFSGIHVVNPEIFSYMHDGVYTMTSLYLNLAANHKISTFRHDEGFWADIGTPENLENVRKHYAKNLWQEK
jgi:NDP-sugar pyrophosphorylase family protein